MPTLARHALSSQGRARVRLAVRKEEGPGSPEQRINLNDTCLRGVGTLLTWEQRESEKASGVARSGKKVRVTAVSHFRNEKMAVVGPGEKSKSRCTGNETEQRNVSLVTRRRLLSAGRESTEVFDEIDNASIVEWPHGVNELLRRWNDDAAPLTHLNWSVSID